MITADNFIMVAMKAYDNPSCKTLVEFESDLFKFTNLVRLCSKPTGPIVSHLLLNQVVILLNLFNQQACIDLMFFKVKEEDYHKLNAVLLFLNRPVRENVPICQPVLNSLNSLDS